MLIIISDLHLTDGTSGTTIGPRAFKIFKQNLRDLAYEASFSLDKKGNTIYKPIESLEIILLGDILDIIRSSKWLDDEVRPWDDYNSPEFITKVKEINDGILSHNKESLDIFKSLKSGKKDGITLPEPENGMPKKHVEHHCGADHRVPVDVNLYYMVGNHDWFYHLEGSEYNDIRESVCEAMGLSNPHIGKFPHDPSELKFITDIYEKHQVFARHGDIHDPFNYDVKGKNRNKSSLGDAIVIELLNRFPSAVETQLRAKYQNDPELLTRLQPCFDGLKETDNVRPLLYIPIWVDGLLDRTCQGLPDIVDEIKYIWNDLCDDFLNIPFVKSFDSMWNPIDAYDKLEYGMKITKHLSFDRIARWINTFQTNDQKIESYAKDALREQEFENRQAKFIVYGHTHYSEVVALDCTHKNQNEHFGQIYINSGTWRQVYRLTQAERSKQSFLGYKVMTYLSFYQKHERKDHEFEVWNGVLG